MRLIKTFILGLILGLLGSAALIYFVPAVDLHREVSLILVRPNLGNREAFHINLPYDRIFAGGSPGERSGGFPAGVEWPKEPALDGARSEIFKLRDDNDVVVGIGARISSTTEASGSFIQWMLHLPARGSIFAGMQLTLKEGGFREGVLMAGTREFEGMTGTVQESFNTDAGEDISGRLELVTLLVGAQEDEE